MEDGMRKRKLGSTDLELTVIGLGTWAMDGGGWQFAWRPQDDEESIKTIHRALDLGINWIDTAATYGLGHAEEIVGKALKGMSERPMIATKCSRVWNSEGKIRKEKTAFFKENAGLHSLAMLGVYLKIASRMDVVPAPCGLLSKPMSSTL